MLRTTNDLVYGTRDTWDRTRPGDNIHPALLSTSFSSVGCLTLHGTQTPGGKYSTASGQWKSFRKMAKSRAFVCCYPPLSASWSSSQAAQRSFNKWNSMSPALTSMASGGKVIAGFFPA